METWLSTLCTREAAAFAAIGVAVRIIPTLHADSGKRVVRFLLATRSDCGLHDTSALRADLRSGALESADPAHPLLAVINACLNRAAIMSILHSGAPHRLAPCHGGHAWRYVTSDTGLPGISPAEPVVKTHDTNLAAALATAGFPILHIDGSGPRKTLFIAAFRPQAGDGAALVEAWRRDMDSIPFSHVFAQAARGLRARSIIHRELASAIENIIISHPKSQARAVIRSDATPAAWDRAKRFFDSAT